MVSVWWLEAMCCTDKVLHRRPMILQSASRSFTNLLHAFASLLTPFFFLNY